jgi:hypothetical protein
LTLLSGLDITGLPRDFAAQIWADSGGFGKPVNTGQVVSIVLEPIQALILGLPFHGCNAGSNPAGDANILKPLEVSLVLVLALW